MDKFLLAEDPLRSGQSGTYIIHLQDPIAIIKIEDDMSHVPQSKSFHYEDDIWALSIYHWGSQRPLEEADALIEQAWQWYLEFLDS